jgi:hypothetical protein
VVNVVGYDVEHEVETPSDTRRGCARTSIRQKGQKTAKRTIENYGMLHMSTLETNETLEVMKANERQGFLTWMVRK